MVRIKFIGLSTTNPSEQTALGFYARTARIYISRLSNVLLVNIRLSVIRHNITPEATAVILITIIITRIVMMVITIHNINID
jgi:hypothetical protein